MMNDYDRIAEMLIPLEGEDIALRAKRIVMDARERKVLPMIVVERMVNRLIVKHGIKGKDREFLESLKE